MSKSETDDQQVVIWLPKPLLEDLRRDAEEAGVTEQEWVRYILRADVDRRERIGAARAGFVV